LALVAALGAVTNGQSWNDLRASCLPGKAEGFAQLPRSINEINNGDEEWAPVSSTENDCSNGGLFNGIQYVKQNNYSVGLLFDVNGIIAGVQMFIPHNVVLTETNNLEYGSLPMYQNVTYDGEDYFVLTAYVVEPSTICTTGRTAASLTEEGTGTGIWIQNGPSADTTVQIPQNRPESENEATNQGWTKNNCLPSMGFHNFFSVKQQWAPTSCTKMVPVFGLYDKDSKKLHGFGFHTVGNIIDPRFEQPSMAIIRLILGAGNIPQCVVDIKDREGITSLHVYFRSAPQLISCPVVESGASYVRVGASYIRDSLSG